jgi:choline-sulfatase
MQPSNLVVILSDEHTRGAAGCYGGPPTVTPAIDRLAASGTRFTAASANCPICIPSRASLATGRYVHQVGFWDNGQPYDGSVPGWAHALKQQDFAVVSIGKLHFRSTMDDNGFTEEIAPLHVVDGIGDALSCLRDDAPMRRKRPGIDEAGPGSSSYIRYDTENGKRACAWLREHAADRRPWVLFVGFVLPHPPYFAPPALYDRFEAEDLPLPPQWREIDWPRHPALEHMRGFFDFARPFPEQTIRRLIAAYYGAVAHMDAQVGRILETLEQAGLTGSTRVVYTSDHGECLGARGLFGKFTMYEESIGVPLVASGPGVPAGRVITTPVSLVDVSPTVIEAVGAEPPSWAAAAPGRSLLRIAAEPDQDRSVFAEYHAVGSRRGYFMLRRRDAKYVHYVDGPPQLFDLRSDPLELRDLASDPAHGPLRMDMERELRALVDPEAVDERARADQRKVIERLGGRAALEARGAFDNSPVPGEKPAFH